MGATADSHSEMECVSQTIVHFGKTSRIPLVGSAKQTPMFHRLIFPKWSLLSTSSCMVLAISATAKMTHAISTVNNANLATNSPWMAYASAYPSTPLRTNAYAQKDTFLIPWGESVSLIEMCAYLEIKVQAGACNAHTGINCRPITKESVCLCTAISGKWSRPGTSNAENALITLCLGMDSAKVRCAPNSKIKRVFCSLNARHALRDGLHSPTFAFLPNANHLHIVYLQVYVQSAPVSVMFYQQTRLDA